MNELQTRINKDLNNQNCKGLCIEVEETSLTAKRLNRWEWEVISETKMGNTNQYKLRTRQLEEWACELAEYDKCEYFPHFSDMEIVPDKSDIERRIRALMPKMCSPFIHAVYFSKNGKTHAAFKSEDASVWFIDGKKSNFSGVVKFAREKLNEGFNIEI